MTVGVIGNKERSAYWDNIKGFLILLVVFGHVLYKLQTASPIINTTVDNIYMFHMPAFIFVSGYFGKSERSRSFESIIKLIFLFFIFNSITVFIEGYTAYLQPIYSYWYLIALIVWRLTAHRIAKFKFIQPILIVIALIIGFFPAIDNHFAAARVIGFYPFYMFGYQLSEEKNNAFVSREYWKRAIIGAVLLFSAEIASFASTLLFSYKNGAFELEPYERPMDAFGRIVFFIIAILLIYAIRCFAPDKKIPFLTEFGRNSLWIFVFHRLFTLWIGEALRYYPVMFVMGVALLSTFIICFAFGNDFFCKFFNKFLSSGAEIFTGDNKKITFAKVVTLLVAIGFAVVAIFNSIGLLKQQESSDNQIPDSDPQTDIMYPAMTDAQKESFDNAFRITFAGDLILLEDQVNLAFTGDGYDFTDVFENAEPYISSADMAIGVFEGPMAGADKGYSTGNYDDGKELYLNFPDEFGMAVKNAGFDLVTTANNHMLDKGEEGALRTLDVMDDIGLDHTGSYRNQAEKDSSRVKIVEVQGIKFAVLSYTFGSNYTETEDLIDGQYSYMTSIIRGTEGEEFDQLKASVEEDFKAAKALNPDLIIVLPHVGTQFLNQPDETQKVWFEIFKENGADIILGDHPHVVEPAAVEDYDGRNVFTAYCPGNFANVYREYQGDTSMLVDVYIDRDSKEVIGGSVVPLYTYAPADGNYKAVPIYEIMNDPDVRSELTVDDLNRASEAHKIVTRVVFGDEMDISSITERYYFDENGFIRSKNEGLELTDEMAGSTLYGAMQDAGSICFIGDSITEGTKNGGCPWYEPIEAFFPDKTILNYSKGSCTVSYMLDHIDQIPEADLYVIALGTNDVRYRDDSVCAMTSDEYVKRLDDLKNQLAAKSPDCRFVFIAPWYSIDGDPFCSLSFAEKTALNEEFSGALEKYCSDNSFIFINANGFISDRLKTSSAGTYLLDHIHPNATNGVVMYSEAVLLSGKDG